MTTSDTNPFAPDPKRPSVFDPLRERFGPRLHRLNETIGRRAEREAVQRITLGPAHWFLRVPLAITIFGYGLQKVPDAFIAPGSYGVPAALFVLSALAELLGPVALIVGGLIHSFAAHLGGFVRVVGDVLTRLGGFAIAAAVAGVIGFFYWGPWSGMYSHVIMLVLALFFVARGNRA